MEKAKKVVVTLHRTKIRVKNIFSKKFARIKYNLYPHSGFLETAIINFVSQLLVDSLFTC